ncbi:tRNA lysidine(34) synthetase TilS [Chryseomicrobium imtechense]
MEQEVLTYMTEHHMMYQGKRILLACSGGADSVALVRFFHHYAQQNNWMLGIVHADHGLRGDASTQDRVFVEALAEQLDIPVYSKELAVKDKLQNGGNTQQVCREERYAYFAFILTTYGYDVLAQGHHGDDQIETVLMELVQGQGMRGIPEQREFAGKPLIRPLLSVNRTTIERYLHTLHQPYREDASNESTTYMRNRFRQRVLPSLYEENRTLDQQVRRLVEERKQDEDILQTLARTKFDELVTFQEGSLTLDTTEFCEMAIALQRRFILLVWKYLQPHASALSASTVASIIQVTERREGTQSVSLPNGYVWTRAYTTVTVAKGDQKPIPLSGELPVDEWVSIGQDMQLLITQSDKMYEGERWYAVLENEDFPLHIRTRRMGDVLDLGTHHKKVSRLFIDSKIPREKREGWPLLVTQKNGILGLIGLRHSSRLTKTKKTPWVIWIKQEDSTC